MSRRRPDGLTAAALLAAAVTLTLGRHAGLRDLDGLPARVADAIRARPAAGAAALLGIAAAAIIRRVATRRLLTTRERVELVPAEGFDPQPDAVLRFAAQLARTRATVRGWLDRPASAIRVTIASGPDGQLRYALEAPRRSLLVLRAAARSYGQVELRQPEEAVVAGPAVARAELRPARMPAHALADLSLRPDPLTPFATAMSGLDPAHGESAAVAVDLLPLGFAQAWRTRRRLLRRARPSAADQLAADWSALTGEPRRPAEPAELLERSLERKRLDTRLGNTAPLFRIQVLVRASATAPAQAKRHLHALLSCFDQFADTNAFRVRGLPIPGIAFLGSDKPPLRTGFDRRYATGRFGAPRTSLASAVELRGLLKPPTVHCDSPNVVRGLGAAPPPANLPAFDGSPGVMPLGLVTAESGERLAGLPVRGSFFTYLSGRSRYGKTELALCQFLHLVRSGHGALFLDPHEDAIARLKPYLADERTRDRVIELNLASRHVARAQPGWNLFDVHGLSDRAREDRLEAIVDAFASALRWDERNSRALTLTTQAAQALIAVARAVPPDIQPTLFQIPTLLSNESWRQACMPVVPAPVRAFFTDRFPRLAHEAITPVTNLIDRLRASSPIACLLGQSRSTYSAREAMDRGLIVLACPGAGGVRDRLVANLLVYDLFHAAKGRADMPPEKRRPFFDFLDEVQTYDGASSGNLAALLEQTAKYGNRAVLLNQNPERLTQPTLNAVTTNRSHLLTTALNAKGAGLLAREWGGEPDAATVTRLERHHFLASVTLDGKVSRPFLVRTKSLEELYGDPPASDEEAAEIGNAAGRHPASDVLAHLDRLDKLIVDALRRSRRDGTPMPNRDAPAGPAPARSGARRVAPAELPQRRAA